MRAEGRWREETRPTDAICHPAGVSPNWWGPVTSSSSRASGCGFESFPFHRMRAVPCAIPDLGLVHLANNGRQPQMAFHGTGLPLWPALPLGNISSASTRPAPIWNENLGKVGPDGPDRKERVGCFLLLGVTIAAKALKQRCPDVHHRPRGCKAWHGRQISDGCVPPCLMLLRSAMSHTHDRTFTAV